MARAGFAKEDLRSFIERIERLEEEKKAVSDDISEVYREAKGRGFDTKIMRIVVQLRKLDPGDLRERDALLEVYRTALDMGGVVSPEIEVRAQRLIAASTSQGLPS